MSDWQAISPDPCLKYSPFHHPELLANIPTPDSSSFSLPPTCWNKTEQGSIFHDMSNAEIINGNLVLNHNLLTSDIMLNCRLHASASTCYICKNPSNLTAHVHVELHYENTHDEICYNSSTTNPEASFLKFSLVCDGSDSACLSLCLHIHHQESHSATRMPEDDTKLLFDNTYVHGLLLLQKYIYESARNACVSETANRCHWIPDSLVTDKTCWDCQPICRGLSHTMTFIQFVAGSIWFMLTYPVAEVALPVVISDSALKEYQV